MCVFDGRMLQQGPCFLSVVFVPVKTKACWSTLVSVPLRNDVSLTILRSSSFRTRRELDHLQIWLILETTSDRRHWLLFRPKPKWGKFASKLCLQFFKSTDYLMDSYCNDSCISPILCTVAFGQLCLENWFWYICLSSTGGVSGILYLAHDFSSLLTLKKRYVLPYAFALLQANGTGICARMHWDSHLIISVLPLVATPVGDFLKISLLNSFNHAAFHSWPLWSLSLFASYFGIEIDVGTRQALNRSLCTRYRTLMPVFNSLCGHFVLMVG